MSADPYLDAMTIRKAFDLAAGDAWGPSADELARHCRASSGPSSFTWPREYLMKVLAPFVRSGLVETKRGRPQRYRRTEPKPLPASYVYLPLYTAEDPYCIGTPFDLPGSLSNRRLDLFLATGIDLFLAGAEIVFGGGCLFHFMANLNEAQAILDRALGFGITGTTSRHSFGVSGKLVLPFTPANVVKLATFIHDEDKRLVGKKRP